MNKTWDQAPTEALVGMAADVRDEYDQASIEAECRLLFAELVYNARAVARITQTELARRPAPARP